MGGRVVGWGVGVGGRKWGGGGAGGEGCGGGGGGGFRCKCWGGTLFSIARRVLELEGREAAEEFVAAAGAGAEGHVTVDYFGVVLFLDFETEESRAILARLWILFALSKIDCHTGCHLWKGGRSSREGRD